MPEQEDLITLVDEAGNELEFLLVEAFEIDHKKYVLLEPVEDPEFGAIIFAVETDEHGEEILRPIDDDDEFDAVSKAIEEILNED